MNTELLKRWQAVHEKSIGVEEIDTAVMIALQYLNPEQIVIKREKGGQTIVYSIILQEAGEESKVLGRYTITPFKHFLNWFSDNRELESVVFEMIILEIETMIQNAENPIQKQTEDVSRKLEGPQVSALGRAISDRYNVEELRTLARKLSTDYENLPGETRDRKAEELVDYAKRHGKVPELLEILRGERPRGDWSEDLNVNLP